MRSILYNVMEILKAILDIFLDGKSDGISAFLSKLSENSFDLGKTLSSFDLKSVLPIIEGFMGFGKGGESADIIKPDAFSPIKKVADLTVVATLNSYFESGNAV